MLSTGNDIVALDCVDVERSNDKKFYSKILADSELVLYQNSPRDLFSFDKYLWMLWSIKESAFKFVKRINSQVVFSPVKFVIQYIDFPANHKISRFNGIEWEGSGDSDECFAGSIKLEDEIYYFNTLLDNEFIASVVSDDKNFEDTIWGIKKIDQPNSELQSQEVRAFVLNKLNSILELDDLRIEKNINGCPIVVNGTLDLNIPVSLAHHGRFVAWSGLVGEVL